MSIRPLPENKSKFSSCSRGSIEGEDIRIHRGPRLFHDFGRILESPMVSLNTRTRNRLRNTKWSTMTMGSWMNGRDGDHHHRRHRHATTKSMLSNVFVHFKLWIDERERIVPRCLVPAKARSKKRKRLSFKFTPSSLRCST